MMPNTIKKRVGQSEPKSMQTYVQNKTKHSPHFIQKLKKKNFKMCECSIAESCINNIVHTKEKFCVGPINHGMPKIHKKCK
jgi:hypothetical protein